MILHYEHKNVQTTPSSGRARPKGLGYVPAPSLPGGNKSSLLSNLRKNAWA